MVASVVLAVSVLAVSVAFSASYQNERVLNETMTAISLGRQLMEEIVAKPYYLSGESTTGKDPGETTHSTFDSIKDYQGFSEQISTLTTLDGTQTIQLGGSYKRQASVSYRTSPSGSAVGFGDFALVTVTVTSPGGQVASLVQLVSNAAIVQQ